MMRRKRVLIVGSGGREHALAWKLRQSPDIGELFVAPGNAGTDRIARNVPVAATDLSGLVRFVEDHDIDLTVVGPEAPLVLGLADVLRDRGRKVFGPSSAAARIEGSKAFAKDIMIRAGVPTARHVVFDGPDAALEYVAKATIPLVVKADGLAAGKGVTVCQSREEASTAVQSIAAARLLGSSEQLILIEEALEGPEVSLLALVDGERVAPLPLAQDHKRLGEGDTGPNTGGMGAYAPVPFLDETQIHRLTETILQPVVSLMADEGTPYQGVLYAGLMLTADGPRVLEFNCRFGDPEAQVILPVLEGDLLPWLQGEFQVPGSRLQVPSRTGNGSSAGPKSHMHFAVPETRDPILESPGLQDSRLETRNSKPVSAVGVVLAAPGYPDAPRTGSEIFGLDYMGDDVLVFHAGTARTVDGRVVTAGGRVLTIVGVGHSVDIAAERAYRASIHFDGMQWRPDIAWQAREVRVHA